MTESKSVALPLGYTPSFQYINLFCFQKKLASPQGFEPRTHGLEGRCSIQLSYEPATFGADDENRTHNNSLEGCGFTTKLHPHITALFRSADFVNVGAEDEIRTRDPRLGKAMLYP